MGEGRGLIVCDVGGVLLTRGVYLLIDELAAAAGRDAAQLRAFFAAEERVALWLGWSETAFFAELVSVAGPPELVGSPARWRARLRELLQPLEPGTAAVRRWAAIAPVWLLTNHQRDWAEPPLRASGVWQVCERHLLSEELGLVKPDPVLYRRLLDAWGGPPERVLVVDADPLAVAAAAAAGTATVLADGDGWVAGVERWLAGAGGPRDRSRRAGRRPAPHPDQPSRAAWAAARRATGSRYGEQLT